MMPRMAWIVVWGLVLLGTTTELARAQEVMSADSQAARIAELEHRVKELEELVRRVEGKVAAPPASLPGASTGSVPGQPVSYQEGTNPVPQDMARLVDDAIAAGKQHGGAGWDKGFYIESADKQHTLRITGQIQTDYRQFLNEHDTTDISTFLLRRARLGIEATVFNYYEFRFLPDFGQGKATIQDSYLNIHYIDGLQFQVGKFKEPVSYEQLIQDRFVPTMERSLIDQLVPARDIGAMIHGQNLFNNQFDWGIGIFNGEINGGSGPPAPDSDTNRLRDMGARVAWRPLNYEALPEFVHYLQFGVSGTTGIENEAMNPLTLKLPSTVPFFTFNSTVQANGLRTRITPEVSYFFRGFGFAAQYYQEDQQLSPSTVSKLRITVPFTGGYGMMTYLLTGEQRTTYSEPITPLRPFDPCHPFANPGAWELVVRASHLDVGSQVFAPGAARLADPTKYTDNATELTVGFNWYLNSLVRMQFNYEHGWFGNPVLLGPPNTSFRSSNALLTRMQIIF
jgi:phosphate-selective porin OprO and OprP